MAVQFLQVGDTINYSNAGSAISAGAVVIMGHTIGIALVDSFLLARKFIPRWKDADDTESVFWKYVMTLLPQVASDVQM